MLLLQLRQQKALIVVDSYWATISNNTRQQLQPTARRSTIYNHSDNLRGWLSSYLTSNKMSEIFPPEVQANILSFLIDRRDILPSRSYSEVNVAWYHQVDSKKPLPCYCAGCVDVNHPTNIWVQNFFFVGRCLAGMSTQDSELRSRDWCNNAAPPQRTRGHLPEPRMDFCSNSDNNDDDNNENNNDDQYTDAVFKDLESLTALDLGSSYIDFIEELLVFNGGGIEHTYGQWLQRRLNTWWRHAHLSKYTNLKQVSARGCLHLKQISAPFTLLGLDCSSCARLEQIIIPLIRKDDHDNNELEPNDNPRHPSDPLSCRLVSLNLHGCRSLRTFGSVLSSSPTTATSTQMAAASSQYSRNLQQVDLSSCLKLSPQWVAALLQSTHVLESLSLRYIATDEMIVALSQSASVSSTLRLVDLAFSRALTDGSVETLVQAASAHLERVNLRGCSKISSRCYNQTPILLLNKKKSGSKNDHVSATAGDGSLKQDEEDDKDNKTQRKQSHSRKGDNLFYFVSTQEEQAKKDRSSNTRRKRKHR